MLKKKIIIVCLLFGCAFSFTAWDLTEGLLLAKDQFLFPAFSLNIRLTFIFAFFIAAFISLLFLSFSLIFSSKNITFLVGIELICAFLIYLGFLLNESISLISVLGLFASIVFPFLLLKGSKIVSSVMKWLTFLGTAVLFVAVGMILSISIPFSFYSQTTDLENYMIFDPAVDQQNVMDMFPSKELVEDYISDGYNVSYEYSLHSGMFDSESTYSIVLDIHFDEEQYKNLKNHLVKNYGEATDHTQETLQLTVENTMKKDIDGHSFSIYRDIKFDDKSFGIVYSVSKNYID